ncbi:MAG: hypothetical protein Q7U80_00540, partial [Thiobacillus sp.]|nr:hypothetical protein [Thiobacillus sp.]
CAACPVLPAIRRTRPAADSSRSQSSSSGLRLSRTFIICNGRVLVWILIIEEQPLCQLEMFFLINVMRVLLGCVKRAAHQGGANGASF